MKIPNGHLAAVDRAKLCDYCLDPNHLRGRHKARMFSARLGIRNEQAEQMERALRDAVSTLDDAVLGIKDQYGQRFILDFEMTGPDGTAIIRSVWIIRSGELQPRLVTCYVR